MEKPLYFDPFGQTGLLTLAIIWLTLLAKRVKVEWLFHAPPEEEKEEMEEMKQGEVLSDHNHSSGVKNESYPAQDKEEDHRSQNFRPKWRH